MSWLDPFFLGISNLAIGGAAQTKERGLNLVAGTNVTITAADDPTNARTNVTIAAGAGGGVTWANDLAGSSATNQWVVAITGAAGAGASVALGAAASAFALTFAAAVTAPSITHTGAAFSGAIAATLALSAQANTSASANSLGGPLSISSGASSGASVSAVGGAITAATNATPIVITTTSAHGLVNGQLVTVAGVVGNTAANGTHVVGSASGTTYTLVGSSGNGAWTSGGTTTPLALGGPVVINTGAAFAAANAGYVDIQTAGVSQLRILTTAIVVPFQAGGAPNPIQFGTGKMPTAGFGLIQFPNTTGLTKLLAQKDTPSGGTLDLSILATDPAAYIIRLGDPSGSPGSSWSALTLSAAAITASIGPTSNFSVGTATNGFQVGTNNNAGNNVNAYGTGVPVNITQTSVSGAAATGQLMTIRAQDSTGTGATVGGGLTLTAGNAAAGTGTGGDLSIGGGTGASTNGAVNFINQTVATTATAFAGGAAIPATCGYLPVKIAGILRKLVVVQT